MGRGEVHDVGVSLSRVKLLDVRVVSLRRVVRQLDAVAERSLVVVRQVAGAVVGFLDQIRNHRLVAFPRRVQQLLRRLERLERFRPVAVVLRGGLEGHHDLLVRDEHLAAPIVKPKVAYVDKQREDVVLVVEGCHVVLVGGCVDPDPAPVHQQRDGVLQAIVVPLDVDVQCLVGLGFVPVVQERPVFDGLQDRKGAVDVVSRHLGEGIHQPASD